MTRDKFIYSTISSLGSFYKFNKNNGSLIYSGSFSGDVVSTETRGLVTDKSTGSFYLRLNNSTLQQYNSSGSLVWTEDFFGTLSLNVDIDNSSGSLYIDDNTGSITQINSLGSVQWSSVTTPSSDIICIDIDDSGSVFTGTLNGSLNKWSGNTGTKEFEYTATDTNFLNLATYNGSLFVTTRELISTSPTFVFDYRHQIHNISNGSLIGSFITSIDSSENIANDLSIDSTGSIYVCESFAGPILEKRNQNGSLDWDYTNGSGYNNLVIDEEDNVYATTSNSGSPGFEKISSSGSLLFSTSIDSTASFLSDIDYTIDSKSVFNSDLTITKNLSDSVNSDSKIDKYITGSWISDLFNKDLVERIYFNSIYTPGSVVVEYRYIDSNGSSLSSYSPVNIGSNELVPSVGSDFSLEIKFSGSYYSGNTSVYDITVDSGGVLQTTNLGSDINLSSTNINRVQYIPSGSFTHLGAGSFSNNNGSTWTPVNSNREVTLDSSGSEILFRLEDRTGSMELDSIRFMLKQDDY